MCNQFSDVLFVDTIGRGMLLVEVWRALLIAVSRGLGLHLLSVGVIFKP